MGYRPMGFTTQSPDYNSRDYDQPTREPAPDPLREAFGNTEWGANWQVDGVFDERNGVIDARNGRHSFTRIYATSPFKVLVDVYKVQPNPGWFEDGDVAEAVAKMREIAIAKAGRIATQVDAHNAAHPTERYGLVQIIGDDAITKDDVSLAASSGSEQSANT